MSTFCPILSAFNHVKVTVLKNKSQLEGTFSAFAIYDSATETFNCMVFFKNVQMDPCKSV